MKTKLNAAEKLKGFEELLQKYLSPDALAEYKKIVGGAKLKNSLPNSKTQLGKGEVLHDVNALSPHLFLLYNTLITFVKDKLDESSFYDLIFYLSKLAISKAEFEFAKDLNEFVLENAKNKSKFKSYVAHANLAMGDILSRQAKWKESILFTKRAGKLFASIKDFKNQAICENLLGAIYSEQGNLKKAKSQFENALSLLNTKKDKYACSMVEVNLGIVNIICGNLDVAQGNYSDAEKIFREFGDKRRLTEIYHNMGMLFTHKNDFNNAIKQFNKSLLISTKERFLSVYAFSIVSKAFAYSQMGDLLLAEKFVSKGFEICNKLNDKTSIADLNKIKGIIKRKQKKYSAAENFLLTSLRLNKELKNDLNYAETSYELGLFYLDKKNKKSAEKYFSGAYSYYKRIGNKTFMDKIQAYLA